MTDDERSKVDIEKDSAEAVRRPEVSDRDAGRIAMAAFVGTALEWYDYFLYGTAASLVFNQLYFATKDPLVSTMAAFASFAVGFLARPVGAVLFGHIGDRYGRRRTLIITVTLIGVVTGLIGLLPDFTVIGVAAPILLTLLRIVQGMAVGGEWSGAVTLAVEHAPPERRGRYAVLPQIGSPIGTLVSSGAFTAVTLLPPAAFNSWGWRLPFLAAFPLLGVALYLRRKMEESPLFVQLMAEHEVTSVPAVEVVRRAGGRLVVGIAAAMLGIGGFYLMTTFVISYGTKTLKLSESLVLGGTLVAAVGEIVVLLVFGRLAERWGTGRISVLGGIASIVTAFPAFWLIDSRNPVLVIAGITISVACLSIPYAVIGTLLSELFPPALRYSGVAISSNLAGAISGFVPMIATGLLAASGGQSWPIALLLAVIAAMTAVGGYWGGRLRRPDEVHVVSAVS